MEEARKKRVHTVQFHLYKILLDGKQVGDCLMMWGGRESLERKITKGQEKTFGGDGYFGCW